MEDALILIIEAIAMRDGINAAIDMSFKQIIVEGDKKIVIQSIWREAMTPRQIQAIIQDIRIFSQQ